ncbi:hypothetical protein [Borrelia persica]|nr:hypothetical protein [Borrelia persica]
MRKKFNSNPQVTTEDLGHILEESLIFVFRIFFISVVIGFSLLVFSQIE